MTNDQFNALEKLEDELDILRAPRDYHGRPLLRGISIGPHLQGNPERGYGGPHLQRIRKLRKEIAALEKAP